MYVSMCVRLYVCIKVCTAVSTADKSTVIKIHKHPSSTTDLDLVDLVRTPWQSKLICFELKPFELEMLSVESARSQLSQVGRTGFW